MSTGEFAEARLDRMHDVMASYVERGVDPYFLVPLKIRPPPLRLADPLLL